MNVFGNVKISYDDIEIIEILHELPMFEELGDISVLKFMQDKTDGFDFGTVIFFKELVYTVYKFDKKLVKKEEDAGLILTISNSENTLEQLEIWLSLKEAGMDFSKKIFTTFEDYLSANHFIENYFFMKKLKPNA